MMIPRTQETTIDDRSHHLLSKDNDFPDESVLACNQGKGGTLTQKNPLDLIKKRYDLHGIVFKENGLPDGSVLAYFNRKVKVLEGYKKGNGILCSCCNTEVSPSTFEAHAGFATRRQPYRSIYTSNGFTLHELSISLLGDQNLTTTCSVTKCMICDDGGQLLSCTGCLKTFHADCLDLHDVPVHIQEWLCPYCSDCVSSNKAPSTTETGPINSRVRRVFFAVPTSNIDGCVICRKSHYSIGVFNSNTVLFCDQCQKEYHVGCLNNRGMCDLKEIPEGNWFCCKECCTVHDKLTKLICKKYFPLANQTVHWCLLTGKNQSSENKLLLSKAAAIFQDAFYPIPGFSFDMIPSMLYGTHGDDHDFVGTHCAILAVGSTVASAGILRIFGLEVAELTLVATTKHNRRKGYFRCLFSCIEMLLMNLKVKRLILPANENVNSMWRNKFGFKVMAAEELNKCIKEIPIMLFQGVLMLEKSIAPASVNSNNAAMN